MRETRSCGLFANRAVPITEEATLTKDLVCTEPNPRSQNCLSFDPLL